MLEPELERAMRARFADSDFARWMGMQLVSLGEGTSEVRIELEPHHLNPGKIAHGGVIASLLDVVVGLAHRTLLGMGSAHVTVQLQINYLRPVRSRSVIARGTAVHKGQRVGYGEGTLLDEDERVLARGNATFMVVADPSAAPGSDT